MPLPNEEFALVQVLESGPDEVVAQVTVRSDVGREEAERDIERRLAALDLEELILKVDYRPRMMAGVYSDPDLVRASHEPIRAALGEQGLVANAPPAPPIFSEDFGSLLLGIPGAMFWLGVANPEKGISGMPHSPDQAVDEAAIVVGAKAMAAVLWNFLERASPR